MIVPVSVFAPDRAVLVLHISCFVSLFMCRVFIKEPWIETTLHFGPPLLQLKKTVTHITCTTLFMETLYSICFFMSVYCELRMKVEQKIREPRTSVDGLTCCNGFLLTAYLVKTETGTITHKTQHQTGYLNMVPNQRQWLTPASDWEPYQAKHRNRQTRHTTECPLRSHPDQTKHRTYKANYGQGVI